MKINKKKTLYYAAETNAQIGLEYILVSVEIEGTHAFYCGQIFTYF